MINEAVFFGQVATIALFCLGSLYLGQSALVTFVCLSTIMANIFVLKQTTLFGLNATCSDAFAIAATLGLNLLQEYFGKRSARTTIWLSFFFMVFYLIMSQLHLNFVPSPFDTQHSNYLSLMSIMPRISIASFVTFLLAQLVDYTLYGWLRTFWKSRFLVLRNLTSLVISQLFDTILFTFLGLYGVVHEVWSIIIVSYTIKLCVILLSTPFVGGASVLIANKK